MPEISKDVVALLQYLLPGFLAAWVFYGVTSHPKPVQFERVIQALIFTLVVRVLVFPERMLLEYLGRWKVLRPWDAEADLACSLLSALVFGLAAAYVSNTDGLYTLFRKVGLSKRSAHPSEWCGTLSDYPRFIVLHMKDDRRLYGWPKIWPSDPEKGHFFVTSASWMDEDGNEHSLEALDGLLVDVEDVKWIEFVKQPETT